MNQLKKISQIVEKLSIDPKLKGELLESILEVNRDMRNLDFKIKRIHREKQITENF